MKNMNDEKFCQIASRWQIVKKPDPISFYYSNLTMIWIRISTLLFYIRMVIV